MINSNTISKHNGKFSANRVTQDWSIGNMVKVGFLKLRVVSIRDVKDGMPDIYTLESIDGTKRYEFIPHNGLKRIN